MKQEATKITSIVAGVMFYTTARHAKALEIAYVISEQELTINLHADGSASVTERLTYESYHAETFHHTLHLLDYNIHHLTIHRVDPLTAKKLPLTLSTDRSLLTYQVVEDSDDLQRLQLFYPSKHEPVSFMFAYEIDNFVTTYADLAELTALQTEAGLIQEEVDFTATIQLPELFCEEEACQAQLINLGPQAQLSFELNAIRIGIPATAMTKYSAIAIQLSKEYFPQNPNQFPDQVFSTNKD